jgi:hypothetical protein
MVNRYIMDIDDPGECPSWDDPGGCPSWDGPGWSRMVIWTDPGSWVSMILGIDDPGGVPRSDIPDSIRRDMKSQDLSWRTRIGIYP